jgi:hypothetical protein
MRRRRWASARLGVVIALTTTGAGSARADVAPAPMADECQLLPKGAPCWVLGQRRGTCDDNVDPDRGRERHDRKCRLGVKVEPEPAASGSPSASPAGPAMPSAPGASPDATAGGCSVKPERSHAPWAVGAWLLGLALGLVRWMQTQRSGPPPSSRVVPTRDSGVGKDR